MFPDVWGVCPHLNCSRDTTWRDANSHCIPGFSFYSSSPPEQDSYSQSPTSYDVEHNDICVISCLMYRQRDTKDYHIRSHRLCEVVFSFWRRQSYLRSGTGLLFQKHMHTTGSICAPRPWLQNLQSPRMAAAVLMFVSMTISRLFFFFPPSISLRCHMMQIKRRLALNVPRLECLPSTRAPGKKTVMLSEQLLAPTHTLTHFRALHLWWFKPCPFEGVKRGYLRQMSSEKQVCLKSHPQKECTPARTPHRPIAGGAVRLTYIRIGVTVMKVMFG